jgi:uncharacterized membrane protein
MTRIILTFFCFLSIFVTIAYASFAICKKFLSTSKKKELQSFVSLSHAIQGSIIALLSANLISIFLTQKTDFKRAMSEEGSYLRALHIVGQSGNTKEKNSINSFIDQYINTVIQKEIIKRKSEIDRIPASLLIEQFYRWIYVQEPESTNRKKSFIKHVRKELTSLCHARSKRMVHGTATVPSFILVALAICVFFLLMGMGFYIKKMHVLYDVSLIICCASLAVVSTTMFQLNWTFRKHPPIAILKDIQKSITFTP